MKKIFTLVAVILPLSQIIAQTLLTQEFGKSEMEVREFLKAKNFAKTVEIRDGQLTAMTDNYTVTYSFDQYGLYKIETVSHYKLKKEGDERMDDFRMLYTSIKADIFDLSPDKSQARFAAVRGRELHEVAEFSLGKNGVQIKQSSLDLDRMPGLAMSQLRQDGALYAMIHK